MSSKGEDLKRDRVGALMSLADIHFVRFKGATLVTAPGTMGYVPLDADRFARLAYEEFGYGVSKSNIADLLHGVEAAAPDWTEYSHLIGFGDGRVWNARTLDWDPIADEYVYETSIIPQAAGSPGYVKAKSFLLELSMGDEPLAYDYQQAIAPLFMKTRPSGILWFLGDGANGKSALMAALYMCFGRFFASLNTSQLEDGKSLPVLQGKLGNIVQEGSEARIEEASNYKLIGTHQSLTVRRMYTQDVVTVSGDFHTIFNANNIPTFADKTEGTRRRTWTIPFPAHFKDDPGFEERTFTPEFLGGLMTLALEAAVSIYNNGNQYEWSKATLDAKALYDTNVNSAEAFVAFLSDSNIRAVKNFGVLNTNYHYWCIDHGFPEMTVVSLKRVLLKKLGATWKSLRVTPTSAPVKRVVFDDALHSNKDLTWDELSGYAVYTPTQEAVAQLALEEQEDGKHVW